MAAPYLAPATLFVALGVIGPLALLFRYSLNAFVPGKFMVEALTAENYFRFFADPFYLNVFVRTLRVALLSTLACIALGFPLAYVLARTQSRFKNLLIMAVILPLFVGNAVRAAGFMTALGSKGFVNVTLLGIGIIREPLEIMFTEVAVLIGIIAVNLPFMVLTLQSVIEGIDRGLEEAAYSLGAPPISMARHVLLPLAMPGIFAGALLTFILAMNAYATPVLLGGPKFQTMGPLIYGQFLQQNNWPFGGAIAIILTLSTLLLTVLSQFVVKGSARR